MKKRISKLFLLIPILYIGMISFFLYLHFFDKEKFEDPPVGEIYVSGFKVKDKISELSVKYKDLEFFFSESNPLVLVDNGGNKTYIKVNDYLPLEHGIQVRLEKNVYIDFKNNVEAEEPLQVRVRGVYFGTQSSVDSSTAKKGEYFAEILMPFKTDYTVNLEKTLSLLSFSGEDSGFFLLSEEPSLINLEKEALSFMPRKSSKELVLFTSPVAVGEEDPYLFWINRKGLKATKEEYEAARKGFINNSYKGWVLNRFNYTKGLWSDKAGALEVNEFVGSAMLSEAVNRGVLENGKAIYKYFQNMNPDYKTEKFPEYASTYLGELDKFVTSTDLTHKEQFEQAQSLIRQGNPEVLNIPHLIPILLNNGSFSLLDDLASNVVMKLELDKYELPALINMGEIYFELLKWVKGKSEYFEKLKDIPRNYLVPLIIKNDAGAFIGAIDGSIDIFQTIRAARLMILWGENFDAPEFFAAGYKLILSCLKQTDESGFLPLKLFVRGDQIVSEGIISPEELYSYFAEEGYYPRSISLYPHLDPGVWVYTAARFDSLTKTETGFVATFKFPVGNTHFLFFKGLENVSSIKMHNYEFPKSPLYHYFNDGWNFDPESRTLFLKARQYTDTLKVEVTY